MTKRIQIFKPGKHVASNGAELSFTESDLQAAAAAYDPAIHEAPIVIGHPRTDGPAYGWIKALNYADGLDAEPHEVNADFSELLAAKAFKKVSASFYTPTSPANPVPGVYYLRHVGFLGAQPPAVKGLRAPEFSDSEEGVVEFAEWDDVTNASLWRRLREWVINKFGQEEADKVIPGYDVQQLEQSAQDELKESMQESPAFSEPSSKGADDMSAEEKARLAALEAENAALKQQQADFAEAERKRAADARHTGHLEFAEGLIREGKLLPAYKDLAVATLDYMSAPEQTVEFGEGEAKQPLVTAFRDFLSAQAKQVDFSEASAAAAADETVEFSAPQGYTVDKASMELHNKATSYAKKNNVTYVEALSAVQA